MSIKWNREALKTKKKTKNSVTTRLEKQQKNLHVNKSGDLTNPYTYIASEARKRTIFANYCAEKNGNVDIEELLPQKKDDHEEWGWEEREERGRDPRCPSFGDQRDAISNSIIKRPHHKVNLSGKKKGEFLFFQYDANYTSDDSAGLSINFFGITEEGKTCMVRILNHLPYIAIRDPYSNHDESIKMLLEFLEQGLNERCKGRWFVKNLRRLVVGHEVLTGEVFWEYTGERETAFIKIYLGHPELVKQAEFLLRHPAGGDASYYDKPDARKQDPIGPWLPEYLRPRSEFSLFDARVDYIVSFFSHRRLVPASWMVLAQGSWDEVPGRDRASRCDLEVRVNYLDVAMCALPSADVIVPSFRVLSWDIETLPRNGHFSDTKTCPVLVVAFHVVDKGAPDNPQHGYAFVLGWVPQFRPDVTVFCYDFHDEARMISDIRYFRQVIDHQVEIGYNTNHFDQQYMDERSKALGDQNFAKYSYMYREKAVVTTKKSRTGQMRSTVVCPGIFTYDMLNHMYYYEKFQDNTLGAVAANLLGGETKEEFTYDQIASAMTNTRGRIIMTEYCYTDAVLPYKLFNKLGCLHANIQYARVFMVNMQHIVDDGAEFKVTGRLMQYCKNSALSQRLIGFFPSFARTRKSGDDANAYKKYKGATVLNPVQGYYGRGGVKCKVQADQLKNVVFSKNDNNEKKIKKKKKEEQEEKKEEEEEEKKEEEEEEKKEEEEEEEEEEEIFRKQYFSSIKKNNLKEEIGEEWEEKGKERKNKSKKRKREENRNEKEARKVDTLSTFGDRRVLRDKILQYIQDWDLPIAKKEKMISRAREVIVPRHMTCKGWKRELREMECNKMETGEEGEGGENSGGAKERCLKILEKRKREMSLWLEFLESTLSSMDNDNQAGVITLDFEGLYPSIIMGENLCYSTLVAKKTADRLGLVEDRDYWVFRETDTINADGSVVAMPNDDPPCFVRPSIRKGILPMIEEDLKKWRDEIKKKMGQAKNQIEDVKTKIRNSFKTAAAAAGPAAEKAEMAALEKRYKSSPELSALEDQHSMLNFQQLAIKTYMNSVYGITGMANGKLSRVVIAKVICGEGRNMIQMSKWKAETHFTEPHYPLRSRVIYGDTDSIFVAAFGLVPRKDVLKALGAIMAKEITKCFPRPKNLQFEKVYLNMIIGENKKMYAGRKVMVGVPEDKLEVKGYPFTKRGACRFEKTVMGTALQMLIMDGDAEGAEDHVKSMLHRLVTGDIPIYDLIINMSLGKMVEKYPSMRPCLEVAIKYDDPANPRKEGDRIEWVFVKTPPSAKEKSDMAEDPEVAIARQLPINYQMYVNRIHAQIVMTFGPVFGGDNARVRRVFEDGPHMHYSVDPYSFGGEKNIVPSNSQNPFCTITKYLVQVQQRCKVCGNLLPAGQPPPLVHSDCEKPRCRACGVLVATDADAKSSAKCRGKADGTRAEAVSSRGHASPSLLERLGSANCILCSQCAKDEEAAFLSISKKPWEDKNRPKCADEVRGEIKKKLDMWKCTRDECVEKCMTCVGKGNENRIDKCVAKSCKWWRKGNYASDMKEKMSANLQDLVVNQGLLKKVK